MKIVSFFSFRKNFVVLKDYFLFSPGVINMQSIKHGNKDTKKRKMRILGTCMLKEVK